LNKNTTNNDTNNNDSAIQLSSPAEANAGYQARKTARYIITKRTSFGTQSYITVYNVHYISVQVKLNIYIHTTTA